MASRFRVNFQQGWAEGDSFPRVELADRSVPQRIDVHFPGIDGQPELNMRLEVLDGRPQIREMRITSVEDGREVRDKDLRAVDITQWVEDIFAACAMPFERNADGSTTLFVKDGDEVQLESVRTVQAARSSTRSITPKLLKEAAHVYREHVDAKPIDAVAAHFNVSKRTASEWITKARSPQYGFLNPTKRGKKGV